MKSLLIFAIYFSLFILSHAAFSKESCSDLIIENEAVNLQNVRSQDGLGWCYAYAAADLLSFKFNKRISAASLNDNEYSIRGQVDGTESRGSNIIDTLRNYLKKNKGLCLEKDLPSSDFAFCTHSTYKNFLRSLYGLLDQKSPLVTDLDCLENNISKAFPDYDFGKMLSKRDEIGTQKIIEKIYEDSCKEKHFKDYKLDLKARYTPVIKPKDIIGRLHEELGKGKLASISYDYTGLNAENREGGHESVVVGRRKNSFTGQCEFLVRNSWGKTCDLTESTDLSCHQNCDESGECRHSGHFWVSEKRLEPHLIGVTYFN